MADVDCVRQIQRLCDSKSVGSVVIDVMPFRHLAGASMPAPVMSDDAIPLCEEVKHLRVPVVRAERPAVMEHDGLGVPRAPVLVEDLHVIIGGDVAHGRFS
jgi:hypothetical protein